MILKFPEGFQLWNVLPYGLKVWQTLSQGGMWRMRTLNPRCICSRDLNGMTVCRCLPYQNPVECIFIFGFQSNSTEDKYTISLFHSWVIWGYIKWPEIRTQAPNTLTHSHSTKPACFPYLGGALSFRASLRGLAFPGHYSWIYTTFSILPRLFPRKL